MFRTKLIAGIVGAALLGIAGAAILLGRDISGAEGANARIAVGAQDLDAYRNREIQFYEQRAKRDPWSAGDQMMLAQLFMQRARETGNYEDVLRGETAARRSLDLREAHNARAYGVLALSLLEQHRFAEALEAMETLVKAEPENPAFRASLGEILMELGEYERSRTVFRSLEPARESLDVAPRLARWLEITGHPNQARALLYRSRDLALKRVDLSADQVAWFHLRLGDLELRHGHLDEAERSFQAGLALLPEDYRLLSAMSHLAAARGDWDESIRYGEQVLGKLLDPTTLVLLSEVHAARGDQARADEYANVMKVSIANQAGSFHRQWSLFLLDRGERIPEILEEAREELRTRKDVFGYDVFAWALHKQGQNIAAKQAMASALRVGVQDAMLYYHAGMIESELGNRMQSVDYLDRALEINPNFHPLHAPRARAELASMRGAASWKERLGF
jgi:tetratricopeptide (TPR) repeat protein